MAVFWICVAILTLGVAAILWRAMATQDDAKDAAPDLSVYKAQLAEIDRDLERQVLTLDDAETLRTEVKRRLLTADRDRKGLARGSGARVFGAMAALAVVAVAFGTYTVIGAPGYGDLPLETRKQILAEAAASRPSQLDAEARFAELSLPAAPAPQHEALVAQLREAVAERPDDARGLVLLARNEALLGNYRAAIEAQERLLELKGPKAATPQDIASLAELMVVGAGGYVSPEAENVLRSALARDPSLGSARYYLGSMYDQIGRADRAFAILSRLLAENPNTAPWSEPIREQIDSIALAAGMTRYEQPPRARGPSAADVAEAQDMSPEDRAAMIQGMVDGLSNRLATEGGPPQDWARLIGALGVLGNQDQARAVLEEARRVFAEDDAAQQMFANAAARAGVTE